MYIHKECDDKNKGSMNNIFEYFVPIYELISILFRRELVSEDFPCVLKLHTVKSYATVQQLVQIHLKIFIERIIKILKDPQIIYQCL